VKRKKANMGEEELSNELLLIEELRKVKLSRGQIMCAYNHARTAVKLGKINGERLRKALGAVLSGKDLSRPYLTTLTYCQCWDSYRGLPGVFKCWHQLALCLRWRAVNPLMPGWREFADVDPLYADSKKFLTKKERGE
jgi:hypothetical protein